MPKMLATAFCASEAAHTAATSWPIPVAVMMIGMDAPPAAAGTKPVSTSPSAMDPARNVGTPIRAGLPAGIATAGASAMFGSRELVVTLLLGAAACSFVTVKLLDVNVLLLSSWTGQRRRSRFRADSHWQVARGLEPSVVRSSARGQASRCNLDHVEGRSCPPG